MFLCECVCVCVCLCLGMIKTVSGIFQEYAERLLNECGFTQFGFRVLSAPY